MGFVTNDYSVIVAGQDVTSKFNPLLLSIDIDRHSGKAADECKLELADPDGAIFLPQNRAHILVNLNGQQGFKGFVSDVDYKFSRKGRTLTVSASSIDHGSKVKEPVLKHLDNADLPTAAQHFCGPAGLSVHVAGSITSIARDYWLQQNESVMAWGQRIADEVGASWKIIGDQAYMVAISEGISVSGKTLQPIYATYGDNLIEGNVATVISRPKFKNVEISYFDRKKGERVKERVSSGIDDVDSDLRTVITSPNASHARHRAHAHGKHSKREKGGGDIVILGDVSAEPEAVVTLAGIREGIDGQYRISSVTHTLAKGEGFRTKLVLKEPHGKAGVDTR